MATLRIAVVGDDALSRGGLAALVAGLEGLSVAGQLATADAPASALEAIGSEAVVWDLGEGQAERLRAVAASLPVVVVLADEERAGEALGAGARGLVFRDAPAERLGAALAAVVRGLTALEAPLAAAWLRMPAAQQPGADALTPRELEALALLGEGLSNKSIAQRLGIGERTAKFHVESILAKLGVESRAEAIVRAVRLGMLAL